MSKIHVTVEQLHKVAYDTLVSLGVPEDLAKRGAKTLSAADSRGVDSHGVTRLSFYEKSIKKGENNADPNIRIIKETPVSAVFDTDYGIGIATADMVMDKAIDLAKKSGVGIATAINGHHFGIAGHYAMKAAEQGLIGFACAPSFPLVAPTGGKEKVLGNSPNSMAFPAGHTTPPMMLDMASTMVSGGKVEMFFRRGEKIPNGWILDRDGKDSADPGDFNDLISGIQGSLLPMAGPKGYCIIVMIELLSSILSGAKTGQDLIGGGKGLGFYMMAIDPEIIRPLDELKKDLDDYYTKIKNSAKKEGVEEIYLPGEIEYNNSKRLIENGIELNDVVAQDLLDLAIRYGRLPADAVIADLFN